MSSSFVIITLCTCIYSAFSSRCFTSTDDTDPFSVRPFSRACLKCSFCQLLFAIITCNCHLCTSSLFLCVIVFESVASRIIHSNWMKIQMWFSCFHFVICEICKMTNFGKRKFPVFAKELSFHCYGIYAPFSLYCWKFFSICPLHMYKDDAL